MGSESSLLEYGLSIFEREFGVKPEVAAYAPGRVNLIGEHTDYNDGFVLPMALPMVTIILGRRSPGKLITVVTKNESINEIKRVEIELPSNKCDIKPGMPKWANYVKGVIANYIGDVNGFQAVIVSDVPTGGGLSSSASLEVATYMFLDALNGEVSNTAAQSVQKALACQRAEHDYAGMPCGIMDQFISVLGRKNNALLIDCRSLSSELIPFTNEDVAILITNSNVKHELTGSEYSSRREQCYEAAKLMNKKSLRDASIDDVTNLQSKNIKTDIIKRARHVVSEIQRTQSASVALKANDMVTFGKLMLESHISLRDDFEVSCKELDNLVDLAMEVDGVLGSRMTGGGFGGCTVTILVKNTKCHESCFLIRISCNIKARILGSCIFSLIFFIAPSPLSFINFVSASAYNNQTQFAQALMQHVVGGSGNLFLSTSYGFSVDCINSLFVLIFVLFVVFVLFG